MFVFGEASLCVTVFRLIVAKFKSTEIEQEGKHIQGLKI